MIDFRSMVHFSWCKRNLINVPTSTRRNELSVALARRYSVGMRNGGCNFYSSVVQNAPRQPQAWIANARAGPHALGLLIDPPALTS
jgi:hypothetical protein